MPSRKGDSLSLSIEEIERIALDTKEDLQRQANQGIRKKDWEQGVGALASMEAIDNFVYSCRMRAGVFAPASPNAAAHAKRKKKTEPVSISDLPKVAGGK